MRRKADINSQYAPVSSFHIGNVQYIYQNDKNYMTIPSKTGSVKATSQISPRNFSVIIMIKMKFPEAIEGSSSSHQFL